MGSLTETDWRVHMSELEKKLRDIIAKRRGSEKI
jgi:hypothetical protein